VAQLFYRSTQKHSVSNCNLINILTTSTRRTESDLAGIIQRPMSLEK
jgi:hypothetical protein